MAGRTGHRGMFTIQVEGEFRVIHRRGLPAIDRMTTGAIRAQLTAVDIVLGVAANTGCGRAFVDAIDMTAGAGHGGMFPVQMEREFRVVNIGGLPAGGRVTGCAIGTKLSLVGIICAVATDTS